MFPVSDVDGEHCAPTTPRHGVKGRAVGDPDNAEVRGAARAPGCRRHSIGIGVGTVRATRAFVSNQAPRARSRSPLQKGKGVASPGPEKSLLDRSTASGSTAGPEFAAQHPRQRPRRNAADVDGAIRRPPRVPLQAALHAYRSTPAILSCLVMLSCDFFMPSTAI